MPTPILTPPVTTPIVQAPAGPGPSPLVPAPPQGGQSAETYTQNITQAISLYHAALSAKGSDIDPQIIDEAQQTIQHNYDKLKGTDYFQNNPAGVKWAQNVVGSQWVNDPDIGKLTAPAPTVAPQPPGLLQRLETGIRAIPGELMAMPGQFGDLVSKEVSDYFNSDNAQRTVSLDRQGGFGKNPDLPGDMAAANAATGAVNRDLKGNAEALVGGPNGMIAHGAQAAQQGQFGKFAQGIPQGIGNNAVDHPLDFALDALAVLPV